MKKTAALRYLAVLLLGMYFWPESSEALEIRQTTLQKGIYTFENEGLCEEERNNWCPDRANEFKSDSAWGSYASAVCAKENKDKCICNADVVYPQMEGDDISPATNQAFKKAADGYACKADISMTKLSYEIPTHAGNVISVVFNGYSLGTGGNGSCHSQITTLTANSRTGHVYTLDEVLNKYEDADIKNSVSKYFFEYLFQPDNRDDAARKAADVQWKKKRLQKTLDDKFWDLGFYIKDKQLFVDLNDYLIDCAHGPSFPVPIPRKYVVNKDILKLLR